MEFGLPEDSGSDELHRRLLHKHLLTKHFNDEVPDTVTTYAVAMSSKVATLTFKVSSDIEIESTFIECNPFIQRIMECIGCLKQMQPQLQYIIDQSPNHPHALTVVDKAVPVWNAMVSAMHECIERGLHLKPGAHADFLEVWQLIRAAYECVIESPPEDLLMCNELESDTGQTESDSEGDAVSILKRATAIADDLANYPVVLMKIASGRFPPDDDAEEVVYRAEAQWNEFISLIRQVIQLDGQVNIEESYPRIKGLPSFIRNAYRNLTSPKRTLQLEEMPDF